MNAVNEAGAEGPKLKGNRRVQTMKREVLLLVVGLCAGVKGVAAIRAWQHGGARVATVAGTTRAVPGPQTPVTTSGEGPLDPAILADVYGIHFIAQAVDDGTLPTLPNGQHGVSNDATRPGSRRHRPDQTCWRLVGPMS